MGTHYSIPHDCDDEKPNGKVEFQEAEECQHAVHTQLHVQLCDQQLHEGGQCKCMEGICPTGWG